MIKIIIINFVFVFLAAGNVSGQWTLVNVLSDLGQFPCLSVYGPNELVIAGGGINTPKVYKSTNGGISFINISGNLTGPKIFSIYAVNENLIFAGDGGSFSGAGGNAKLWKTTNGGLNWSVVLSTGGIYGFFNGIIFSKTNPSFGIAVSDAPTDAEFFVAKTTNGGNNWIIQSNTPSGFGLNGVLGSVFCIDEFFYGWGMGPFPIQITFTSNGGSSWLVHQNIGLASSRYATGLAFSDDKLTGLIVGDESLPIISRSTDGGNTWNDINTGLTMSESEYSRIKWVHGTNVCFITSTYGMKGCIGKSTNGGLSWIEMNTAGISALKSIDALVSGENIYGYSVSAFGEIIRLQQTVGIKNLNSDIVFQYKLEQNFPNPFNPETKIRFHVKSNDLIQIKIYNVSGKEIETLLKENLPYGVYEVKLDASSLPSGVYYYTLIAQNFKETKKMVLLK
ncbi:MAG TPA: T9SS type A sorting domain-containing protein [Ignavibacteria bacterium]|nr:T9SS type A sorting domain-containing protein [Ignavibacteria bacterium]